MAPDGVEWQVRRRWSTRRFGWTWKRRSVAADAVSGLGNGIAPVIEAGSKDPLAPGRRLEWHVIGWRRSQGLIDSVISDLAAGREPTQGTLPR